MATPKTNVTFGDISTQVSNKDAADKIFNINGNAKINEGKFAGLEAGNFSKTDGTANGWFTFRTDNGFDFNCNGLSKEEVQLAVKALLDFGDDVQEAINSKSL